MRTKFFSVLLLLGIFFFLPAKGDVIINEIMASNAVYSNGHSYDWIELYNTDNLPVSLAGWYLSNDPFNPQHWAFPDDAFIAAHGYLVVFCTDDTTDIPAVDTVCATFKLSAQGETLCLTTPDASTHMLTFGKQYGNVSYGIPLGKESMHFLEYATPGSANADLGYDSRAAEPVFETAAGFYEHAVMVSIRAEEGMEIRYTTDCSEPTRFSSLYTQPISVTATTVIRARAFSNNHLGSTTAGATFFIDDPSPVPVISLYTDDVYLFSKEKGLMNKGYSVDLPNYMRDWQYPCQLEYFDRDGKRCLCQMGTFKIAGKTMRAGAQKSFAVYARKAYGSNTFDYPFFSNRDYDSYSALLLRYSNTDSGTARFRDAALSELSDGLGLYYQAGYPILLYLNGQYWGHYNLRERANKESLAQWEGITDPAIINSVNILEATGVQDNYIIAGNRDEWTQLMYFCKNSDMNDPDNLKYLLGRIDVDSLFNHAIFAMLVGNFDANNTRMYCFPGGKWKFMLHDLDVACSNTDISPVHLFLREGNKKANASSIPHWPLTALLEVPEYKDEFLRRTAEIINNYFLYDIQVEPVLARWRNEIAQLMPRHISRFHPFTLQDWNSNVTAIMNYTRMRPAKVIGYICQQLHLDKEAKNSYFGKTLQLLEEHNRKK